MFPMATKELISSLVDPEWLLIDLEDEDDEIIITPPDETVEDSGEYSDG